MDLPPLIFGLVISTLYGGAFHLWKDGGLTKLFLYLGLGWAGFWIGQFAADRLGWTFFSAGPLHLGMATLISLVFLLAGHWLSLVEIERK
jgi:hypothetical protein